MPSSFRARTAPPTSTSTPVAAPLEALARYRQKRDFTATPEPAGQAGASAGAREFVVQKHAASHLHYDFRLELDGTLKSWAVPKGPSLDPTVKRMAVEVEDHPLAYAGFEGTIPAGHYGAGQVIVWDRGQWTPVGDPAAGLARGRLEFDLSGVKLHGRWALVRMKPRAGERQPGWLLIKARDAAARDAAAFEVVDAEPGSVLSEATISQQPAAGAKGRTKQPGSSATPESVSSTAPAAKAGPARRAPVRSKRPVADAPVSHAERVIDAQSGVTKGELVEHYARVAALMLPHLAARPVALVRAPAGVDGPKFFQKHADDRSLPGIERLDPALDPEHEPLLAVVDAVGLRSAGQMNVLELHTWNMVTGSMPNADRMVFDLDPGEGVGPEQLRDGARVVKALLDELGLRSFLKTSGGKGLHIVVPLAPRHRWEQVRQFSEAIVVRLAGMVPQRIVAKSGPKNRVGRIFVDYLRNGWGATTACAWSPRARPGLGVSVPVDWSELPTLDGGAQWTLRTLAPRLAIGNEPWAGAAAARRQTLTRAMKAFGPLPGSA